MHQKLFSGQDLELEYCNSKSKITIVTFEPRNKYISATTPSAYSSGFGRGVFAGLGFNEFLVKKSRNHWYQTDEILKVADIINEKASDTEVFTYGTSMGGFAAINFSKLLNASKFIAMSPLFDIAFDREVEDDRWGQESHILDFSHNYIRNGCVQNKEGYVFYCSEEKTDADHAKCIGWRSSAELVPLKYGGHPCSFFINDTYKSKRVVEEIARGEFSAKNFLTVVETETPRTHYPYLVESRKLERSGRISESIDCAVSALKHAPEKPLLHLRLGNLHLKNSNADLALISVLKALELDPQSALAYDRLSHVYAALKDYSSAADAMIKAIDTGGQKPAYYLRLGECLLKAGELRGAELSMKEAVRRNPKSHHSLVRLSHVFAAKGEFDEAIRMVQKALALEPNPKYEVRLEKWRKAKAQQGHAGPRWQRGAKNGLSHNSPAIRHAFASLWRRIFGGSLRQRVKSLLRRSYHAWGRLNLKGGNRS